MTDANIQAIRHAHLIHARACPMSVLISAIPCTWLVETKKIIIHCTYQNMQSKKLFRTCLTKAQITKYAIGLRVKA